VPSHAEDRAMPTRPTVREKLWSQDVNEPTDIPRIPDSGTHARIFN
jgi:hypothetical protein